MSQNGLAFWSNHQNECIRNQADGLDIKKETQIQIPVTGIHMDPKYYPDPEKFNPENFSKENKAKRSP